MEKKRKLRGKWLAVLGTVMMAVALGMLLAQPSVLQYCIVAPTDEAAPEASGQAEQTTQQEETGALQKLCEAWQTRVLLVLTGPITAVPLILFATAANKTPLSLIGFIQYISPTISLLSGVLVLGEPFTSAHAVCFACIWAGAVLVIMDAIRKQVRQ